MEPKLFHFRKRANVLSTELLYVFLFSNEILCKKRLIVLLSSKKKRSCFCRPRRDNCAYFVQEKTSFYFFVRIWKKIHFFFFKIFFQFEILFCSNSLFSFNFASAYNFLRLKIFFSQIFLCFELFSSPMYSFTSNSFFQLIIFFLNSKFLLWIQNSSFFDSFFRQNSILKSNSRSFQKGGIRIQNLAKNVT